MRIVPVVFACLLTACSTQAVRCERHLTPINAPARPVANALAPSQPADVSREGRSATPLPGTSPAMAHAKSVSPKPATPAGAKDTP